MSRKSPCSESACSSSMAASQLPLAILLMRRAASSLMPRRSMSARRIDSLSVFRMSMRCTRLRMVSNSFSGSSLTMMNTVCCGGSSMSFNSLLAHSMFMRSGSQMMLTL